MAIVKEQRYGRRQELILQNLKGLALRLPKLEERINQFQMRELGMIATAVCVMPQESNNAANNIFEAIEQKMELISTGILAIEKRVGLLETSINPDIDLENLEKENK